MGNWRVALLLLEDELEVSVSEKSGLFDPTETYRLLTRPADASHSEKRKTKKFFLRMKSKSLFTTEEGSVSDDLVYQFPTPLLFVFHHG